MLPTLARRAATQRVPIEVTRASAQLIPPIPLYRRLLRAHRRLPIEMRYMGDQYVKSEFRLTRSTDNPLYIVAFLSQWKAYLEELEPALKDGDLSRVGKKLDAEALDALSSEQLRDSSPIAQAYSQIGQLYELMHATDDIWKSPEQLAKEAAEAEVEADSEKK